MNTVSWLAGADLRGRWREVLAARGPQLAAGVLALAVGVQAALIVATLAGSGGPAARRAPVPAFTPAPRLNVAVLAGGHLFGAPPAPPPADDAHAPQTTMPLVLTGIIAAPDPSQGLAVLGESAAATKVYSVGERIGGATLHAVYSDRVLIERDGRIEALTLPHELEPGGPAPAARPQLGAFERVRRALTDEPGLISDVLRPQPVFIEGKQRGYRVYPGRNARAFASLGLRNGDLVIAVNGTLLDDPNRGDEVLRTLSATDQARVTVMRDGQQQELTLNMSQLATQAEQMTSAAGGQADAELQNPVPAPAAPPLDAPAPATPNVGAAAARRDNR